MIVVLEAHDVVLAEIAAGLYLDQFKVDLARIFEAMPGPAWHVERLVLVQESDVVADRHPRGAAHDHPVLGAVMMHLQRQPPALLEIAPERTGARAFLYPQTTLHDDMNTATEGIDKPWITLSTLRVRRHRERRREGLRLLTLEMPEPATETAIARSFLKPEETTQAWSVIQSVYAAQLSDRALNWLTENAVITTEQRTNAAAILRRIGDWLEQAAAR